MILGVFFRYLEEICEIPIKFDAFSAKIGAKIAKFQWFCLKFMKMSPKFATKICWIVEVGEVQRNINLVDLAKSFQTSIYLQKSASIQPRTSYLIFFNFPSLQGFNFHRPPAPAARCVRRTGWRMSRIRQGVERGSNEVCTTFYHKTCRARQLR